MPRIQDLIETSLKLPCHFSYKLAVAICGQLLFDSLGIQHYHWQFQLTGKYPGITVGVLRLNKYTTDTCLLNLTAQQVLASGTLAGTAGIANREAITQPESLYKVTIGIVMGKEGAAFIGRQLEFQLLL